MISQVMLIIGGVINMDADDHPRSSEKDHKYKMIPYKSLENRIVLNRKFLMKPKAKFTQLSLLIC